MALVARPFVEVYLQPAPNVPLERGSHGIAFTRRSHCPSPVRKDRSRSSGWALCYPPTSAILNPGSHQRREASHGTHQQAALYPCLCVGPGWDERRRSQKIILTCGAGGKATLCAKALHEMGFTDVWIIDGGCRGWQESGYVLASPQP